MGWYTDYCLFIEVDDDYKYDLDELKQKLRSEETANKVSELCEYGFDYFCGLGNLDIKQHDNVLMLITNQKRGGIGALHFLMCLVKYVIGDKIKKIDGSLSGEDSYADMQLGDNSRTLTYLREIKGL